MWEGQKIEINLHLIFDIYSVASDLRWRFFKLLWLSHIILTLPAWDVFIFYQTHLILDTVWFYILRLKPGGTYFDFRNRQKNTFITILFEDCSVKHLFCNLWIGPQGPTFTCQPDDSYFVIWGPKINRY